MYLEEVRSYEQSAETDRLNESERLVLGLYVLSVERARRKDSEKEGERYSSRSGEAEELFIVREEREQVPEQWPAE